MTMRLRVSGVIAAILLLAAIPATAQIEPRYFRADDLMVVYLTEDNEYILPHLSRCFINSLGFHKALFEYESKERITVLLQDFDDYGYAGASPMPANYLTIGIEPFEYVYETSPTNERINWVMSHELLHIVATDQASPADARARRLFSGKVAAIPEQPLSMVYSYLTTPRMYAPRWYHEGMAVFFETWMAGGYGRALGGYDEMVFRTMVHDGAYFYDTIGLESEGKAIDFQVGQVSYLYGTRFVSYLADQYGPQSLVQWIERDAGTKASYRAQFKQVFGTDLDSEWNRWLDWEHQWQQANLETVREYPVTEFQELSDRPLGSVSRAYFDPARRQLITAINYPGEFAHITTVDVDTWESKKVVEVPTPALYYVASLAYDPDSGTLFYTTDNSRQWRDLNSVNLDTGKNQTLLKDIRTGDLAFNRADSSVWGVQHHNGLSTLVRISPPYTSWDNIDYVLTIEYGKDIFDIDVSPDGVWLTAALAEVSGRQQLIRMKIPDLLAGSADFEVLYEFANNSPANFAFSPDGKFLFGTSYYTGVSNVFRYDLEKREIETVTNGLTGFFRPVPVSDDELIAFHYTSKGFIPVMLANESLEDVNPIRFLGQDIVEKYPVVKEWMIPPPSAVDLDALEAESGRYRPAKFMRLMSAYPILEDYRGYTAIGARFNLMDPVGLTSLDITASVTPESGVPNSEKFHLRSDFNHWPWRVSVYYNPADFYDFFGPTMSSRKGYGALAKYEGILVDDRPRSLKYNLFFTGFGGLDTLPEYQEIEASIKQYIAISGNLEYKALRRTIGGLQPEKGIKAGLYVNNKYAESENYPRIWGNLDLGVALPIKYSSVWLRSSAGYSWGDPENTLSNYYFGAFGNNYVDHQEVRRFQQYYSFPGIEINELGGNNFGKMLLEWDLPPLRFKRAGIPAFYCTWASAALFGGAIATNLDDSSERRELFNVGAQIDFKLVIFTNLSTTLSVGYARAFESGLPASNEYMISLKIL
jgi:hypothetical protein